MNESMLKQACAEASAALARIADALDKDAPSANLGIVQGKAMDAAPPASAMKQDPFGNWHPIELPAVKVATDAIQPAPTRPEWVRVNWGPESSRVRRVVRWNNDGRPVILTTDDVSEHPALNDCEWEPADAPTPAPVPLAPLCCCTMRHDGPCGSPITPAPEAPAPAGVPISSVVTWRCKTHGAYGFNADGGGCPLCPPALPAVDRVEVAKALRKAWHKSGHLTESDPWDSSACQAGWLAEADAAIALLRPDAARKERAS